MARPIPTLLEELSGLLAECRAVLDVGCGDGRLAQYFLECEEYVGVDVDGRAARRFSEAYRGWPPLRLVVARWEDVRAAMLSRSWDAIIAWDSPMFIDLRGAHGVEDNVEAWRRELRLMARRCSLLLLSLHPVRRGLIPRGRFGELLRAPLEEGMRLVGRRYLGAVYAWRA